MSIETGRGQFGVITSNGVGAVEWTWSETRKATGQRHSVDDAIIFSVRDGKITYWREYLDKGS
jgi:ketosteroid isomerase-like protein